MKISKIQGGWKMSTKSLRYKYPFEYDLSPTEIEKGTNWVTLKMKNIGSETLKDLDVQLHSLDTYNLSIYGTWL
jgi:hypothetical protein